MLPDGRWLLLGGLGEAGALGQALIKDLGSNQITQLPTSLNVARAWHTATLLPDGTVLIVGGIDGAGGIVTTSELFDPETKSFELLGSVGPTARAHHTATLLTDGTVLLAGGIGGYGEVLRRAEIWDPRTQTASPAGELNTPRQDQTATLLPDGQVLLWGGTDDASQSLRNCELYDPQNQSFSVVDAPPSQLTASIAGLAMAGSIPEDRAQNVPVRGLIGLRFSERARVQTVNTTTVAISGPEGQVAVRVVPAESGMLAFVSYEGLLPATTYTVSMDGVADTTTRQLPHTDITFTTAGDGGAVDSEAWIPDGTAWRTGRSDSTWRKLPPLQAPPGVTAIAGQVLKLNGEPLPNVTLQVENRSVRSSSTGRFLLVLGSGISGHRVLLMNGSTANQGRKNYGRFEYGMDVKSGVTNVLSFTIWMPLLDTAHTVTFPVPTKTETVITTPLLRGLELRLPAGTVIRDANGHIVKQISITPIPLDRTPFPLPNVQVPIYFTIQPGGAQIKILYANGVKGAQLIYPNTFNSPPRTVYDFWNYEADRQGWYIYGQGRVSADRANIVPDPGVVIYEFTGAMVGSIGAPANWPQTCDSGSAPSPPPPSCGDPIDLSSGLFVHRETDLFVSDVIPLVLTRIYRQNDPVSRAFGIGTSHPYDIFLWTPNSDTDVYLILSDGGRIHFPRQSSSLWECVDSPTSFYKATLTQPGSIWVLKKKDGTVMTFPGSVYATSPQQEAIISYQDRYGNALTFTRDSNSNLTKIASPNGRYIQFSVDSLGRVNQAIDNIGRTVQYNYDSGGRLTVVSDANGGITTYTYDNAGNMLTFTDARGIKRVTNRYDANNRVINQTLADGSVYQVAYTLDSNGDVTQSKETDPRKFVREVTFDSRGYTLTDERAVGTPQQELTTYNRDSDGSERVLSTVDSLGRKTSYGYDDLGNVLSITQLYGTPNAVRTSFTYNRTFSLVASITDPLNHTTNFTYDRAGDLTTLTDALTHRWTFTYNSQGQPLSAADPYLNTTHFSYNAGDLVSVMDPLKRTVILKRDGVGRLTSFDDALGAITQYEYDPVGELTSTIDALGGLTSFTYDADGDLLSVTDTRKHVTQFSYDRLDRLSIRTDPLLHKESYTYDFAGNLLTFTDRRGQKTSFSYDALNRRTKATYGDGSSISYSYDLGNRLTQANDSISGAITRTYDGLDRLTTESTPQGKVIYAYDQASRRTGMTVTGQAGIIYGYDDANLLTSIMQGSSKVSLSYDDANRRTSLRLANGVTTSYSYDVSSELTGLSYKLGGTTLGDLTYIYDGDGRRTSMGGTYAHTALPAAVSSADYNANNELTQWGTSALSYDLNGNLANDGTKSYTWNARNELTSINSGATASFQYDAFGRRQTKTIFGASHGFLYDGINPVQELNGKTVTANLLTGLAVDEIFSRMDYAGERHFLSDALGSTIALTDSTGTPRTEYTYEPFGNTSSEGVFNANSYQYTARENDGTGLYYYRARFYNSQTGRFISEDPIGLAGGINRYLYVRNNPVGTNDPTGLISQGELWTSLGLGVGAGVLIGLGTAAELPGVIVAGCTAEVGILAIEGYRLAEEGMAYIERYYKNANQTSVPIQRYTRP